MCNHILLFLERSRSFDDYCSAVGAGGWVREGVNAGCLAKMSTGIDIARTKANVVIVGAIASAGPPTRIETKLKDYDSHKLAYYSH